MFKTKRTKWVIAIFFTFASLIFGEEMEKWSSFIPDPTMGRANYLVNNSSNLLAYNSNIGIVQPYLKNSAKFCINESLPNNKLVEIGDRIYSTYKVADKYFNSGLVSDPLSAGNLSATVFSSTLNTAGVGPQTNLAIETADKYRQFTMNQFDTSSHAFSDWQMKNSFDMWKMTGNINTLANTVEAGKPNVTFSQLDKWDTRKPLTFSHESPGGKLDINVSRQRFTPTTLWYLPARIREWTSWKTAPNNFVTESKFQGNLDGYSVKINETKVGGAYGFDPMIDSYSKTTSISGSRTERIIGGMPVSDFKSKPSSNIGKILNTSALSPSHSSLGSGLKTNSYLNYPYNYPTYIYKPQEIKIPEFKIQNYQLPKFNSNSYNSNRFNSSSIGTRF